MNADEHISEEAIIAALCGKEAPVEPQITFDDIARLYFIHCDGMYYGSVAYERALAAQRKLDARYEVTDEMIKIFDAAYDSCYEEIPELASHGDASCCQRRGLKAVMQHLEKRKA